MTTGAKQHYSWSTLDELAFIANLAAEGEAMKTAQSLQIYVEALRHRSNWSGLDRAAIAANLAARGFPL